MTAQPARVEGAAQLVLMLGVGSVAACASWSHVVDLAERNGQPGWLAIADAAVLETLAVSMGLDVRRRRRDGEPTRFALAVLVAAVALQLAAQVAQAPVTFWGWTMAALPAVGFLLLVKVAMTRTAARPAVVPDAPAQTASADPEPVAAPLAASIPAGQEPTPEADRSVGAADPTPEAAPGGELDGALLDAGRRVAADLARHDARLSRASLAAGLRGQGVRVGTSRAGELLATLRAEQGDAALSQQADHRLTNDQSGADGHDRHLSTVGARL